ncbi:hypothetical protein VST7929_01212 [Vibrio stylophorae]|uniref:DUF4253 domain-containing protein n=1 Tax=Vibrio stylophorae TaxID=659351 RepID=A0ABM8ZSR4_9VIBR|nr:hypothetical protein [Vibrio stylophorae]CAH0533346.1 hypothetical protein VST7929_01212 [Vibrio stylophorae]
MMEFNWLNPWQAERCCCAEVSNIPASWPEFCEQYWQIQARYPQAQILFSLDDYPQACYTSMHSISANNLDDNTDCDTSAFAQDMDQGDYCGDDEEHFQFMMIKQNLARLVQATPVESLYVERWDFFGEYGSHEQDYLAFYQHPSRIMDIEEAHLFVVPVEENHLSLAAFPNGYWTDNLSPQQNARLAQLLKTQFGLHLFAIGAMFIGFIKTRNLSTTEQDALYQLCVTMYSKLNPSSETYMPALVPVFKQVIAEQPVLLLSFSD